MIMLIGLILMVALSAGALKVTETYLSRNKKAKELGPPDHYDVDYTRKLEMEIWGYYFTPAEKKTVKSLPPPPRGPGPGSSPSRTLKCRNLKCPNLVVRDSLYCNLCEEERVNKERRIYSGSRRYKFVVKDGQTYKALIPANVPDNAHCEVIQQWDSAYMDGSWVAFKWTDEKTGMSMGIKTTATKATIQEIQEYYYGTPKTERHEVILGEGQKLRSFIHD